MNILIAPNAFKNSLDAQLAAEAIARGLKESGLNCTCRLLPIGDGGDGTGNLLTAHLNGQHVLVDTYDALGRPTQASFGWIEQTQTAIIEMANASGIRLLTAGELNPMQASSYGTGLLIKAALDMGAKNITMCMGGSATVDGGAGILNALGIRFLNTDGEFLKADPQCLKELYSIDVSGMDERVLNCQITILCDVDNPLTGPRGAAAVFGPQKGADDVTVMLDTWLKWFALLIAETTGKDVIDLKHGGTAGGAAAGLHAFLNAKLVAGAELFLNNTGFDDALSQADLVITAEGSIDKQSLQGKAPVAVALRAKQKDVRVMGLSGKMPPVGDAALDDLFYELICINNDAADLASALKNTYQNLQRTAYHIGIKLSES